MDLFGLDVALVVAIVGITQKIKSLVPLENRKWYLLCPLVLSVIVAFSLTNPLVWQEVLRNFLVYFGVSVLFYDAVIEFVEKKKEEIMKRIKS